tara:strand:- start:1622 stop:1990 length:369 start_codon:yes stop_codon:yes gene_type:complete
MGKSKIATVRKKVELLDYTEITVYSDIVINNSSVTRLGQVGVKKDDKVYKKKPSNCNKCKSNRVVALEVLGACNKDNLFWICDDCEHLHLKYTGNYTEKMLEEGSKLWTNPNDWLDSTENIN